MPFSLPFGKQRELKRVREDIASLYTEILQLRVTLDGARVKEEAGSTFGTALQVRVMVVERELEDKQAALDLLVARATELGADPNEWPWVTVVAAAEPLVAPEPTGVGEPAEQAAVLAPGAAIVFPEPPVEQVAEPTEAVTTAPSEIREAQAPALEEELAALAPAEPAAIAPPEAAPVEEPVVEPAAPPPEEAAVAGPPAAIEERIEPVSVPTEEPSPVRVAEPIVEPPAPPVPEEAAPEQVSLPRELRFPSPRPIVGALAQVVRVSAGAIAGAGARGALGVGAILLALGRAIAGRTHAPRPPRPAPALAILAAPAVDRTQSADAWVRYVRSNVVVVSPGRRVARAVGQVLTVLGSLAVWVAGFGVSALVAWKLILPLFFAGPQLDLTACITLEQDERQVCIAERAAAHAAALVAPPLDRGREAIARCVKAGEVCDADAAQQREAERVAAAIVRVAQELLAACATVPDSPLVECVSAAIAGFQAEPAGSALTAAAQGLVEACGAEEAPLPCAEALAPEIEREATRSVLEQGLLTPPGAGG